MNKITDIRVTKTNIAIRKAFIEIMEEEGFSKLNVNVSHGISAFE